MTVLQLRSKAKAERKANAGAEAQLITIWGPHGSTGKSTLALNLAYEFAALSQRVMLLDLDTHAPALNQLLPLGEASAGLAGAARLIRQGRFNTEQLDRLSAKIKHGRTHFQLLPGLPISSRWPEVTSDTVRQLISICSQNFDVIIADVASDLEDSLTMPDTPTSRNAATRAALEISTQVIVCMAGSHLSISRYLNDFAALNELQKTRRLIINRSEPNQQLVAAIRSLTKERIDAVIPNDEPALELAESQKLPLALARRKSPARNAIAALAHKLLAWAP